MKNLLSKIPFFLPLLVVFFCLHGTVENYGLIKFKDVFFISLSLCLISIIFFIISYFFKRDYTLASFVSLYLSGCYFFFGAIQDFFKAIPSISFIGRYSILLPLIFGILFILILFLKRSKENWPKFIFYLNSLFIVYVVVDLVSLMFLDSNKYVVNKSIDFDFEKVASKPDVYFLLFDGYPSPQTLQEYYQFEDTEFTNTLKNNDFTSLNISSNYYVTIYSMASIFNMDYVKTNLSNLGEAGQLERKKRFEEIQQGQVFNIFEKMGYEIENNSIFDVKNIPSITNENEFLLGRGILLTDKIFINRLDKDFGMIIPISVVKYLPFLKSKSMYRIRENNATTEARVIESTLKKNTKPVFNYAHFLLPHGPFFYDSISNPIIFENLPANKNGKPNENFVSYVKYTNKVIKKVVTNIIQNKPNAIVVLISDHGVTGNFYDTFSKEKHKEIYNNICAIHFPYKTAVAVPNKITNVNFFRYFFNTSFGQNFVMLKDSIF